MFVERGTAFDLALDTGYFAALDRTAVLDAPPRRFSGTEKPAKKKKAKKKKEDGSADENAGKKKSSQKPALADIWDAVQTLAPPLKKALGRACRGIHIAPMRL